MPVSKKTQVSTVVFARRSYTHLLSEEQTNYFWMTVSSMGRPILLLTFPSTIKHSLTLPHMLKLSEDTAIMRQKLH